MCQTESPLIYTTLRLVPRYQSRVGILKKRSLWISASAALAAAIALAGCGTTYYFAGRVLPPSGLINRVMIAIQNPGVLTKGALEIVDAFYDTRSGYNGTPAAFSISGYSGALPISIQNMPEEQFGAVYGVRRRQLHPGQLRQEKTTGNVGGLNRPFVQHLYYPQQELRLRRQPGLSCPHRREPEHRRILPLSAFPACTASA